MERKTAFITGISGQDGSYLAEFLLDRGYHVCGMIRQAEPRIPADFQHLLDQLPAGFDRLSLVPGDLQNAEELLDILRQFQPREIYHLGAQSHIQVSFQEPVETGDISGLGTVRLLEAVRHLQLPARIFCASSSEVFGNASGPLSETSSIHPRNPYGAAKAYALHMTRIYREVHGLFACSGILFNHESPRRGSNFVTRKITSGLAALLKGTQSELALGNLEARRDWGFAGDYVQGMWQMLQSPLPQDFVLASGETHSVREFCEIAFAHAGLPITWRGTGLQEEGVSNEGRVLIRIDPQYFRVESDKPVFGDSTLARQELGWVPSTSFQKLVSLMVDHDLDRQ